MNLKELLDKHPIINKSQLAQLMFAKKTARITLHNKLNETVAGTGTQRITPDDDQKAIRVLDEFVKDYTSYREEHSKC